MTLWALISLPPSHDMVTSTKSSSNLRFPRAATIFRWKLFHFRQKCSFGILLLAFFGNFLVFFWRWRGLNFERASCYCYRWSGVILVCLNWLKIHWLDYYLKHNGIDKLLLSQGNNVLQCCRNRGQGAPDVLTKFQSHYCSPPLPSNFQTYPRPCIAYLK